MDLGENVHAASCYRVRRRRRGWTELVTKQRKLKIKFRIAPCANTADEMDAGRMINLELVCKNILLGLVSAAVEGKFNFVDLKHHLPF